MDSTLIVGRTRVHRVPRRTLAADTVAVSALDARTRDDAFALFREGYEGADRRRFERDLAGKQYIILLRDTRTDALKGFSTVEVLAAPTPAGEATVVFSGDTVIDREYWGQKALQREFAVLLVRLKLRRPRRPLYWFLISKGYRTYVLLAHAFPRAVPRYDRADDPLLRATRDALASARFGAEYDATGGIIRYSTPHERVRPALAPLHEALRADPHIRFFAERNPGYEAGHELACLADVRLTDLARTFARITFVRLRRALGRA